MSKIELPVADSWYSRRKINSDVTLITEPHVDVLERANIWHIRGRDRDLLIDSGLGVVPLRPTFPDLFEGRETIALATHTHLDHIGCIHEFEHRWVHPIEAETLKNPVGGTLVSNEMDPELRQMFEAAGYPPLGPYLIHALPHAGYVPEDYVLQGAQATWFVEDDDVIDLGDRRYRVLLTPGHSPGSISLFEEETCVFFAGDLIYDGPLLYEGPGMSVTDYIKSFDRIKELPIRLVHGGHDQSFSRDHMDRIIDQYMSRWEKEGLLQ